MYSGRVSTFQNIQSEFNSGDYVLERNAAKTNLKDVNIKRYHAQYFWHWYSTHFSELFKQYGIDDPGDIPSYAKINPLEGDKVLEFIDFLSSYACEC